VRRVRQLSAALEQFRRDGWTRLPGAFSPEAAEAMGQVVWQGLAEAGIERDDLATWTVERPAHLQRLRGHPAFREVASPSVLAAIDAIMEGRPYPAPKDWGSLFIAFPTDDEWNLPVGGWHIDARYTSPLRPPGGVRTFALLADVAPRSGGTLVVSGSHQLIHKWFSDQPPPAGANTSEMRKRLMAHPDIRDLQAAGQPDERIVRFMNAVEPSGDVALQVVEFTGSAGDMFLLHPLTMHAAAPNAGSAPRLMLSGGVTTDMWGWQEP
jgi:hypothetical protein